jgi:hypothetical protein
VPQPVPKDIVARVRKLAQLAADLRRGEHFQVTRLTSLKSLCREPAPANRFVTYLAGKTLERVEKGRGRSGHPGTPKDRAHRQMMAEALPAMEGWLHRPDEASRRRLLDLIGQMRAEQDEYRPIPFGAVRLIHDWDLLVFEKALHCLLQPHAAGHWAYEIARDYAERYDSGHPSGLVPASAPLVQDIADFWANFFGIDLSAPSPQRGRTAAAGPRSRRRAGSRKKAGRPAFTHRQGQFLAFIHLYWKMHRQGPAEAEMVKYFRVTPPAVHDMVVRLEELGLVTREPGVPRSVRVAIPEEDIPALEGVQGGPW